MLLPFKANFVTYLCPHSTDQSDELSGLRSPELSGATWYRCTNSTSVMLCLLLKIFIDNKLVSKKKTLTFYSQSFSGSQNQIQRVEMQDIIRYAKEKSRDE